MRPGTRGSRRRQDARRRGGRGGSDGGGGDGGSAAGQQAVVDRLAPARLAAQPGLPEVLHQLPRAGSRAPLEHRQHLVCRMPTVERVDEWLLQGDRAVVGARVPPGLEVVRGIEVPVAVTGSLVGVQPPVHAQPSRAREQRLGKAEVGGSVVDRVDVEDQEGLHLARLELARKGGEVGQRVRGARHHGLGDQHRRAEVAEVCVDGVRDDVQLGRRRLAHRHHAAAAVGGEVAGERRQQARRRGMAPTGRCRPRHPELGGQRQREGSHLGRCHRQPMVGERRGRAGGALDGVEAVHRRPTVGCRRSLPYPPSAREVAGITHGSRPAA